MGDQMPPHMGGCCSGGTPCAPGRGCRTPPWRGPTAGAAPLPGPGGQDCHGIRNTTGPIGWAETKLTVDSCGSTPPPRDTQACVAGKGGAGEKALLGEDVAVAEVVQPLLRVPAVLRVDGGEAVDAPDGGAPLWLRKGIGGVQSLTMKRTIICRSTHRLPFDCCVVPIANTRAR